jgi:hypothetical protein
LGESERRRRRRRAELESRQGKFSQKKSETGRREGKEKRGERARERVGEKVDGGEVRGGGRDEERGERE